MQELESKDYKLKHYENIRKQLILKLCNSQKQAENSEQKLKKIEGEHYKAIRAIQGFMEREQQMRDTDSQKERQIVELETELRKRRNSHGSVSLKDLGVKNADDVENDSCKQVNIAILILFANIYVSEFCLIIKFLNYYKIVRAVRIF